MDNRGRGIWSVAAIATGLAYLVWRVLETRHGVSAGLLHEDARLMGAHLIMAIWPISYYLIKY